MIVAQAAFQFLQLHEGAFESGSEAGHAPVDAFQLAQAAAEIAKFCQDGVVRILERAEHTGGEFGQPGAVACHFITLQQGLFFVGLEMGTIDFLQLEAQQVQFLGADIFRVVQLVKGMGEIPPRAPGFLVGQQGCFCCGGSIQHGQLTIPGIQGLVFVRAMEIHEELAKGF